MVEAAHLGRGDSFVWQEAVKARADETGNLALSSKGRAFRSLDKLIVRQGREHVLYGSTLVLAAVMATWSKETGT